MKRGREEAARKRNRQESTHTRNRGRHRDCTDDWVVVEPTAGEHEVALSDDANGTFTFSISSSQQAGAQQASPGVFERLAMAQVAANPPIHPPDDANEAGRRGETLFASAAACTVFRNLRIRDDDGLRHELDVVCVSATVICVVEVKNWSGSVQLLPDGRWQQSRRSGELIDHGDVLAVLQRKLSLLQDHLRNRGVSIQPGQMMCRVVLVNPRCTLEPSIKQNPLVVHSEPAVDELLASLATGTVQSLLNAVLPWRWSSVLDHAAVSLALDSLPTWDVITLSGGRTLEGTLVSVEELKFSREATRLLRFKHSRSQMAHALWVVMGATPEVCVELHQCSIPGLWQLFESPTVVNIGISASIRFIPAGQPLSSFVANECESITLSA